MQGQPLGPLPVPQPRGGRGRRGAAASLVGGGRGWGRAEAVEILAPKGSPGGTAQETGKETRPGPPNLPLVRALQVEKARGTGRRRGRNSNPSLWECLHFLSSQPFGPALSGPSCRVAAEEAAARADEATSHAHRLAEAEAGLESRPAQAPSLHPFFLSFHLAFYFVF